MSARRPEPAWWANARGLRAEGLTYLEIGERLGYSKKAAWAAVNPERATANKHRWREQNRERDREHARAYKQRNREAVRAYDREYGEARKVPCPRCGHLHARDASLRAHPFSRCPGCAERRREQIVAWWAEGLPMREIAERLGWSKGHLSTVMVRMRKQGYDLPYRYRGWAEKRVAA